MSDRPIIFSAPMVRALLAGTKVQTRLVVKPQPESHQHTAHHIGDGDWQFVSDINQLSDSVSTLRCPYGQPGDRLWVREAFAVQPDLWHASHGPQPLHYLADVSDRRQIEDYTGKPSIHMPRWASRITLEVTGVRVERLQDISEGDCIAEGCAQNHNGYFLGGPHAVSGLKQMATAKKAYCDLWKSIKGPGSWDANPWVWVVEFKRVTP